MQENTPSPKRNIIPLYNFLSMITLVFFFVGLGGAINIHAMTPQNTIFSYARTPDLSEALYINQSIPLASTQHYGREIQIGLPSSYESGNTRSFSHRSEAFDTYDGNATLFIHFTAVGCPISIRIYLSRVENILLPQKETSPSLMARKPNSPSPSFLKKN
jgi:hypothetical protein